EEMLHLDLELIKDGKKHHRDQARAEVIAKLGNELVARGVAQHQVEEDDVGSPFDRGFMGRAPVVDRDALEAGPFEHPLHETEHLVVIVDHQRDVAMDQSGAGAVRRRGHRHAICPARGSFSVSAMARSAAERTSWMSALTASGSLVSSAISSL